MKVLNPTPFQDKYERVIWIKLSYASLKGGVSAETAIRNADEVLAAFKERIK